MVVCWKERRLSLAEAGRLGERFGVDPATIRRFLPKSPGA